MKKEGKVCSAEGTMCENLEKVMVGEKREEMRDEVGRSEDM